MSRAYSIAAVGDYGTWKPNGVYVWARWILRASNGNGHTVAVGVDSLRTLRRRVRLLRARGIMREVQP